MRRISMAKVFAAMAVIAAAFAVSFSGSQAPIFAQAAAESIAGMPIAALASASLPGPILEIGVEHSYSVSLAHRVHIDTATDEDFTVTLDGAWAVAYAGTDAGHQVFRAELRDGHPMVRRGSVDVTGAFAATLARPYYFTMTSEGRLVSLSFAAEIDDLARSTLATLASTFQVSTRSHAETWDAVEADSLGDYRARYARNDRGLHRDRVAYERVTGGGAIDASIVTTGTDVTLRADGWPEQLAGHEVTRIGTHELGVMVDARFTLRHGETTRGVTPGWPNGLATVAVDAVAGKARAAGANDRELVDGATLPDLLAELARVVDDSHARGYLFLRIAALLRLDPEAVRAATRTVLDGAPRETAGVVIGALGEAGTPEAQRGLGELLAAPSLSEDARTHAAIALGLTDTPTPATLTALDAAARGDGDISSSATLAQGNAALRMRDDDPAMASGQVDALLARLERATDDTERALVLRALGNTGEPRIVPAVASALAAPSVVVRLAATEALRLVPGTGVDQLLVSRLDDSVGVIRAAVVFAASERDLGAYVAAFDRTVRRDVDIEVRRAIVGLAGARIDELSALRAIVEYVAAQDHDPELRITARALLANHG